MADEDQFPGREKQKQKQKADKLVLHLTNQGRNTVHEHYISCNMSSSGRSESFSEAK